MAGSTIVLKCEGAKAKKLLGRIAIRPIFVQTVQSAQTAETAHTVKVV
jgi:hypothetical protein